MTTEQCVHGIPLIHTCLTCRDETADPAATQLADEKLHRPEGVFRLRVRRYWEVGSDDPGEGLDVCPNWEATITPRELSEKLDDLVDDAVRTVDAAVLEMARDMEMTARLLTPDEVHARELADEENDGSGAAYRVSDTMSKLRAVAEAISIQAGQLDPHLRPPVLIDHELITALREALDAAEKLRLSVALEPREKQL